MLTMKLKAGGIVGITKGVVVVGAAVVAALVVVGAVVVV